MSEPIGLGINQELWRLSGLPGGKGEGDGSEEDYGYYRSYHGYEFYVIRITYYVARNTFFIVEENNAIF
jgi:hypothetical protein